MQVDTLNPKHCARRIQVWTDYRKEHVVQKRERQSSTCCRDFGTKEQGSEGREVMLGTLLKLLVKDKLLHSGKVSVNSVLTPLRKEKRGSSAIRYFEQGDEDVTVNFYIGRPHRYFPIHSFIPVISLAKRDWIQRYLKKTMY